MATTKKKTTTKKTTSTKKQPTKKVTKKQPVKETIKVVEQPTNEKTKNITLKRIYIVIIIILSILLLISSTIEIINIITPPQNEIPTEVDKSPESKDEQEKEDLNKLFSEDLDLDYYRKENNNAEIVGRLEIPGVFNLLLTQTKDNDYYIEYNIKKKRSNKGTEFIDYRNKMTDKQINIYGHNSRLYDLPFKKLENFLKKDFFDKNEYLLFQHEEGRRIYQIAAIKKVTTDYEHMVLNATNQKEHISKLLEDSIQSRELEYDDNTNIIVLQTCVRQHDGHYYILIGFEVK